MKNEMINFEKLKKNLQGRGYIVHIAENRHACQGLVKELIPKGVKVGIPGTVTIRELSFKDYLQKNDCEIFDIWENEERQTRLEQLNADVVLTSVNAVTKSGLLVNLDGTGNRVASMCYGPNKVIAVIGKNKIVSDLEEGMHRVKNVAAPLNYQRKESNTPCSLTGKCQNCTSIETKKCRVMVIHEGKPRGIAEFHIIIVKENLGF